MLSGGASMATEPALVPPWTVVALGDLLTSGPKNGYSGKSGRDARGAATLSLSATTTGRLVLNDDTVKRLTEVIPPHSDLYLVPGDVLVQRSNTIDLVGTTAIYNGPAHTYIYPDLLMRLRFRDCATAHWYWRYANSAAGRSFFVSVAAGSTGSMPKISGDKLKRMPVPLPPFDERKRVAEVLNDVDSLLDGLDSLIAKKRDLKQAAMQQLLSGRTRLPGFKGKWEVKALQHAGRCLRGVSYNGDADLSPGDTQSTTRLLRANNVQNAVVNSNDVQFVRSSRVSAQQILRCHDILICMANGSKALVGKAGVFDIEDGFGYTFGAFMGCFRCDPDVADPRFVFYLFQSGQYRNYISLLLAGSSINNLRPGSIESLEFEFPDHAEQAAIAQVLSDMHAESAALESRRDKTHLLRQAMIQELLTGRTRLVDTQGATA
jgi:type I restriction enzyme, S subunit